MIDPPSGTVTFLFTDIEGSTKRWEEEREAMSSALQRHDAIMRSAIEEQEGYVFKSMGDAFCAAFPTALQALQAALTVQRARSSTSQVPGSSDMELRVRMALHVGAAEERGGDYFGQPVNRVSRLLSAGHGGQVLLSDPTHDLVRDNLPSGVTLRDLGEHRLKDLQRPERIFQVVALGLPSDFGPLRTLENHPNNLLVQPTPFVGREKEVAAVGALLRNGDVHLVSLTGPGGTGKTRLGLQVAAEMLDDFEDGVFFVELAVLTDPALVPSTIAQALGVMESAGKSLVESLKDYLKDKDLLLLLDNFEHLMEAEATVDALLKAAPHLKVLVTSRLPVRLYGGKEFPVPPLSLPDTTPGHLPSIERLTQYEAVRLFIERARDVKPDFQVTNENAPAVAEICVRLDGLPLAIELAAARVRLFPPAALLTRLTSRLKMLTGGATNLPARQRTLRGAIEWSYDLLSEVEQHFFRRMAVFQGGRTLESLEAVCNCDGELQVDVLDGVESLVENSLLQQREGRDGEPRFWMLETIHEYAREKLQERGEGEVLQREHALHFLRLAEEAEPQLTGAEQTGWLHRLEEEHDNMRAALRWAKGQTGHDATGTEAGETVEEGEEGEGAEVRLRIAGALWRFWYMRGYLNEGREQLAGALSIGQSSARMRARAKALNGAGSLAWPQGDYAAARSLHEESLAIKRELGDKRGIASSLHSLGNVVYMQGAYPTARSLYEESLAIRRELGDKQTIAATLNNLGAVAYEQGDYTGARTLFDENLILSRELRDKWGIAVSLGNLGNVAMEQGDHSLARALFAESLALDRELGNRQGIAGSLSNLGNVALQQEDYAAARSTYEESLALKREIGDKPGIAVSLAGLGGMLVGEGQAERGARLLGAVDGVLRSLGAVMQRENRLPYERSVKQARALLGEEAFDRAWQEGRAMSMEAAIAYALEGLRDD